MASYLECDDEQQHRRRVIDEAPLPLGFGDTPEEAVNQVTEALFLPLYGYERIYETPRNVVLVYRSAGEVKVALHVSRDQRTYQQVSREWVIWSLYACHDSEYGADVELEPGFGVWRNFETNSVMVDFEGWGHCDMESARFLRFGPDDQIFIRDPAGRFEGELFGRYRGDTTLPGDALDTGYRRGEDELWLGDDGRALYVVMSDKTERWPRHREGGPFCA